MSCASGHYVRSRNRIIHDYDVVSATEALQDARGLARDLPELMRALQQP